MKNAIIMSIALVMISVTAFSGQNPVPDPDTVLNPVQEGDPAVRTLPRGTDYIQDMKPIIPTEIPDPLRQTLESSAKYTGWEKALLYENKNKDEYLVQFKDSDKTITYRFNKNGKPVWED